MTIPLASVIIPVYNGERYLAQAIECALQQVQVQAQIEITVVDDGSSDATSKIIQGFSDKVKSLVQVNSGTPAARNTGLNASKGDFIAFLDSDDLWPKNKLEIQLTHLTLNPTADIVLGHLQYFKEKNKLDGKPEWINLAEPQLAFNLGAAIIKRSAFERVGHFDTTLHYADDWDWFVRAQDCGLSTFIEPEVTLFSRRHAGNLTNHRDISNMYAVRMIRKTLERRRAQHKDYGESQ